METRYIWEFMSIFFAVVFAFALNNWNENRKDEFAASKILRELANGFDGDIADVELNIMGHERGLTACDYWIDYFNGKILPIAPSDSTEVLNLKRMYIGFSRDLLTIQNRSAYESLKTKGLELIENDSLRFSIINLYEYEYTVLQKFEETYHEAQFQENYFEAINDEIAPHLIFNERGDIEGINPNTQISTSEKKILLSYLYKIKYNRNFIAQYYQIVIQKIIELQETIEEELSVERSGFYSHLLIPHIKE